MVKWAALLLFTGAVLAATGVASLSWWTRHEIYADTVAGYCLQPADLEGFHKGRLDPQATLATLLVQRAQS